MSEYTQLTNIEQILFKREDTNPTGSLKDRGIPVQIETALKQGKTHFVLSSSGNAAISAAAFCSELALGLTVFVSPSANQEKIKILEAYACDLKVTEKPLTKSLEFAKETGAHHLRQATDPVATVGYRKIAYEIAEQTNITDDTAIFVPVSSGTAFVGIYEGFSELMQKDTIQKLPAMHAVQTQKIHPIAADFDTDFVRKSRSVVDAIVPPLDPPRKEQVQDIIRTTNGSGWVAIDTDVLKADEWLNDNNVETSYEGALALAGYWKAIQSNHAIKQPVILLTGKKY